MGNLEEIRKGIERIYEDPRKLKKMQNEREKLLICLEKIITKKQKRLLLKINQ